MGFDFLSNLESALLNMDELTDSSRVATSLDGESGTLTLEFENGRKYSIAFNRI